MINIMPAIKVRKIFSPVIINDSTLYDIDFSFAYFK
jgi:hypothetical protein